MRLTALLLLAGLASGAGAARVVEPPNGAVFPADLRAPEFVWEDAGGSGPWTVRFTFAGKAPPLEFVSPGTRWTPARADWERIKAASLESPAVLEVAGARASFTTSKDPVGAPIFFRAVPNPFPKVENFANVKWKLGWVSSYEPAKTVMSGQRRCFNCHASSYDGKSFGFEFNPNDDQSDRTAYIRFKNPGRTVLWTWRDYFDWNSFLPPAQRDRHQATLSAISPDGNIVVTAGASLMTIAFTPCRDMISYSFPTKGILVYHSEKDKVVRPVPGADDPTFIHIPGSWSPDGRYIYYFGAPVTAQFESLNREPPDKAAEEKARTQDWRVLDKIYPMKYGIYRVPFNEGKGGKAEAIAGASGNGFSSYFPRASPDGKWLAFTRSANGALTLREDSDIYLVPAGGGKERRLRANSPQADSWHTWSPNGRWLAFSSKRNGRQTDIMLTHIDDAGRDSPPVVLTSLRDEDGLSANIPEFFNIGPGRLEKIVPLLPQWWYAFLRRDEALH